MTTLWVVTGPPGSGKSTFGRALAAHAGAVLLDQDTLTNPLMVQLARRAGVVDHDLDHPELRGDVRTARYQCLLDTAADNVAVGRDVVMVAPFTTETGDPAAWSAAVGPIGATATVLLWIDVSAAEARRRRLDRALPRDLARRADLDDRPAEPPAVEHLRVDGSRPAEAEIGRLLGDPG